jgi:hypothetical protein
MRHSISGLYRDFEQLWAASQAIPDTTDAERQRWECVMAKCSRIASQIVKASASNIDEMLIKIRVAAWDIGDAWEKSDLSHKSQKHLEELDRWTPSQQLKGAEYHALVSLRGDLHRLKEAAAP